MTIARPDSDVSIANWSSTAASVFDAINETALDTGDYASATLSVVAGTSTPVVGLDTTLIAGIHRMRLHLGVSTGTTSARVHLMASEVSKGASAWQTVTTTPTTFVFPVTTSDSTNQAALEVGTEGELLLDGESLTLDGEPLGLV